ncbi:Tetratricopeptide repeat [Phytophthora infestans]|uniref:Tetratricopeptide repeat n=1 Tax=Phytophthora infestans TaxID=4787 RepID=A0A833T3K4_PHYIN|nr:Tetratricopeptide repeat [Phytophthora infestans]KAF4139078.1 Tetratricopeptide repeat [Phytophthora infestans]
MEPVRLERQQQVPADHRVEAALTPEDQLAAPLAAVKLAESGDFPRLLVALALRPRLARAADAFGMTALHWVCSDPKAPPRVLLTVARAHPAAAATRNLAGLLPLHLAVRKSLALEAIQALLHVYPKAIGVRTPDGKTPLMLAKQRPVASSAVLSLLKVLEAHARTGAPSPTMLASRWPESKPEQDHHKQQQGEERTEATISDRYSTSRSVTQEETIAAMMAPHAPPPRWALASRCRLCAAKFGYFRQRHHCRSCGASVCGRHSRHRVPLKHLGLFQPQRVCACCFDDLQKQLNVRALERVTRTGGAYPYIDNDDSNSIYSNTSMNLQTRHRRRSKSIFSEPTQRHGRSDWECCTDNNSEASANGFTPVSAPWNWSIAASEAVESLQPSMGSMFLSVAPAQLTVLERQRLLREQQGHSMDSEPTRRRSRQRRSRPHSSALDRSLHVQRMSEVDSACSSDEHELEQRMQQLMEVKRELGETMRRSEEDTERAQREKRDLDALAAKYRDSGYSSPPECEDEDEEAEIAATLAFLNAGRRMSSTAELLEDMELPLDVAATHQELGETLLSKGDFASAVLELQRSVELDATNATAWLQLAKALDGVGEDSEAAEEAVRRALELEPTSIGALSLLGKLLHLRGDHDDAILVFRQALELQCPKGRLSDGAQESDAEPQSMAM